jgi:adenylate cyclase
LDRRLAAILAADVVGFSALLGRDEAGALRALKGHLAALEPMIGLNGGRLVKSTGDGFLAEFGSVVAAVSCAVSMQRLLAERNAAQPEALQMAFRMGLHTGDVVVDGDDILGDGVNIAARLQGVAQPGGIVVSGRVHDDVADKMDLDFHNLGEQRLRNIQRPVRAYSVVLDETAPAPLPEPERPSKPSVAVLAFDNMSPANPGGGEHDWFAEGITEDIITALSRVPWIFVIARNSSFSYRGLAVDVRRVGRELGVRYVLEGSVRRVGNRLRVTGQLIDAETGAHLWADRYDGEVEDVFELQDRITEAVVAAIAPEIRNAEMERAARKRPDSLDAYDHFLRALGEVNRFWMREADASLAAAIAAAPDYPIANGMRAWLQTLVWHPLFGPSPERTALALKLAEAVFAAPEADVEAAAYAGYVLAFYTDGFERGLSHVERAIEASPNCVSAWGSSCLLNGMRGRSEVALEHGERALRLNPRDPMAYRMHYGVALAHLARRDWEAMLRAVDRARIFENSVVTFRVFEVAALQLMGRAERAAALAGKLAALEPGFTVSRFMARMLTPRALDPRLYEPVIPALAAAGLPE